MGILGVMWVCGWLDVGVGVGGVLDWCGGGGWVL